MSAKFLETREKISEMDNLIKRLTDERRDLLKQLRTECPHPFILYADIANDDGYSNYHARYKYKCEVCGLEEDNDYNSSILAKIKASGKASCREVVSTNAYTPPIEVLYHNGKYYKR